MNTALSRIVTACIIATVAFAHCPRATAQEGEVEFPNSMLALRAQAFIEAFNTRNSEAYRDFTLNNRPQSVIDAIPMEDRLTQYQQMLSNFGRITPVRVIESGDGTLTVVAEGAGVGPMRINFTSDGTPDQKIARIGLDVGSGGGNPFAERTNATPEEITRRLADLLDEIEENGFTGVVLIARGDAEPIVRAMGLTDREAGRTVTADTVYTVGSITKQFTAAAILKLQEQGKLSVNDPLTTYFDNVPEDKQPITLHQLLTHTAGFPGAIGDDFGTTATREWFVDAAMNTPLLFAPGERHEYSNVGYSVLGVIVEKAGGQPYEAYLQEHLFKPAGMTRTGYLAPKFTEEELAVGYRDGQRWGTVLERSMLEDGPNWNLRANGGIHSTAGDMLKWHRALQGGAILNADSLKLMYTRHVEEGPAAGSWYGYGWAIFPLPHGPDLITHNGGNGIFFADYLRFVEDDVVVFIATGVEPRRWNDLAGQLGAIALGYAVPED